MANGTLVYNGYTLGDLITTGTEEITGWDDLPPIETGNTPIPMYHGSRLGAAYARERIITWTGWFSPELKTSWATSIAALRSAFRLEDIERTITLTTLDESMVAFGAVRNRAIPANRSYGLGRANLSLQFVCSDPRKYTTTSTTTTIGFPDVGSSGLEYPLEYPLEYGSLISLGMGAVTNTGDAPLPAVYRINGPCSNPSITNTTTSRFIQFTITLTAGQYLEVNTKTGTVLLNGTTDRLYTRSTLSSPLASLEIIPGINSMRVSSVSWSGGANVTITARNGAFF